MVLFFYLLGLFFTGMCLAGHEFWLALVVVPWL
jgi:hypothetical protein